MLDFKVKLINNANQWFNESFETISSILASYENKKIIKRDGGFVKNLGVEMYGFQFINSEVKGTLSYDKEINGWLSVTLNYEVKNNNGTWERHSTARTLGKAVDGVLTIITKLPKFNTDLTVEKATEMQDRIDKLSKELQDAQSEFRHYLTF